MGISPLTKIKIADVSGRKLSPSMAAPVESIISEALARRPDVQSAYAAQKASLANVRAAQAEFMPKFFLSANGTYSSGNLDVTSLPSGGQQPPTVNISGNHLGGSIFAGVTVPLYDGGMRDAQLARARAEADSADARLTQVREDAVRQIVLADNALAHQPLRLLGIADAESGRADDVRFGAGRLSQRRWLDHRPDACGNPASAGEECVHGCLQHGAVGCRDARACDGGARRGPGVNRPGALLICHTPARLAQRAWPTACPSRRKRRQPRAARCP